MTPAQALTMLKALAEVVEAPVASLVWVVVVVAAAAACLTSRLSWYALSCLGCVAEAHIALQNNPQIMQMFVELAPTLP